MSAGDPLIGRQLANFRIERVLGRGGMAQVYYGWDVVLYRPVAIKIIDARYRSSPAYAKRFVQEAQTVALWRHENIVSIYYADREAELYYFAMEYIDGVDLGAWLSQYTKVGRRMPHAEVLRVGRAMASALDYAHSKGVIHRDVKPSNVILASDGRVVLTDFGLALHVEQGSLGEVFGTARYTAPEQARRSASAMPQSDLYSLGVILYEALTGSLPFDDPSPTSVALQHMTLPPPSPRTINPDLSEATEAVLLKALSKSPTDRYPTGGKLMDALESALLTPMSSTPRSIQRQPAISQPPVARANPNRSITERVTSYLEADSEIPGAVHPAQPSARSDLSQRLNPPAFLATRGRVLALAALVIVAGVILAINQQSNASQQPASTLTHTAAETIPTTVALPTASIETAASTSVSTDAPTPAIGATPAIIPPTTAGMPPAASPTVLYPGGRRFLIYYDDNSLYLHNASGNAGSVSPLAFERLDASGAALNRFDGWRWSQYYPRIEAESCTRVEIRGSPSYLRPPECRNRYNSTMTASRDDDFVFWTNQTGASQFRVLWNQEEVARCEIAARMCEVFLP